MARKFEKQVAKLGRPSGYSEEVAGTICQELMEGKSLRVICAMKGMPSTSTVFRWLDQYPGFRELYARAREIQADMLADEIVNIADSETDPNRARVMIDARKWLASKLRPKKYGDRVELNHKGERNQPMQVNLIVSGYDPKPQAIDGEAIQPALHTAGQSA